MVIPCTAKEWIGQEEAENIIRLWELWGDRSVNIERVMKKQSLPAQVERIRLLAEGVKQNPEIKKKLEKIGFTDDEIQRGIDLIQMVENCKTRQNMGRGAQKAITQSFSQQQAQINEQYLYHLSIAKIALRNDLSLWDVLQLNGRRETTVAKWFNQVRAFYDNIALASAAMKKHGVTPAELTQVRQQLNMAAQLRVYQAQKKGETQSATQERQRLLAELQQWESDLRYLAKFALRDDPQQLEALGIVVPA